MNEGKILKTYSYIPTFTCLHLRLLRPTFLPTRGKLLNALRKKWPSSQSISKFSLGPNRTPRIHNRWPARLGKFQLE